MLRTSSYTIFVDLPEEHAEVLLIHGYSGAYDKISRPVARYLRSLSGRRGQDSRRPDEGGDWQPRDETIEVLKRRGYLTEKSHAEEEALFSRLAASLFARAGKSRPAFVFVINYGCNLRCSYCFQHRMHTDPALTHLIRTMTPEVVDRIFAALPALEARHSWKPNGKQRRSFLLFGGEPLLAKSRPTIEHILHLSKTLCEGQVSAISNGTELEAYRDLLGPDKIAQLQITLDGSPPEHDRRRVYPDGLGTFTKIAANISMALDLGVQINLRLNIDSDNVGRLPQIAQEIIARGWPSYSHFVAYVAPVHAANASTDRRAAMGSWALLKQLAAFQKEYPELQVVCDSDNNLRGRIGRVFSEGRDVMSWFRPNFCAAHTSEYIFDAFGDIYACWEHMGDRQIRIGHVSEQGELSFEAEQEKLWRSRNVLSNPHCRRCRYAFYCGGGCAIQALRRTGDLNSNYCDDFAHRFQAIASQAYLEYLSGKKSADVQELSCN